jgi:hypothetical protein
LIDLIKYIDQGNDEIDHMATPAAAAAGPTPPSSTSSSNAAAAAAALARFGLVGRRALVTGATKGIGRAIVDELCALGAEVVLCARSSDDLTAAVNELKAAGHRVHGMVADVSDAEQCGWLVNAASDAFGGRLDILGAWGWLGARLSVRGATGMHALCLANPLAIKTTTRNPKTPQSTTWAPTSASP